MTNDSICCGATINDLGLCSYCLEHTGPVTFEDAEGETVEMHFDRDGILRDVEEINKELRRRREYSEPLTFKPTVAEFAGFVGCVFCFIAIFCLAVMFGGR